MILFQRMANFNQYFKIVEGFTFMCDRSAMTAEIMQNHYGPLKNGPMDFNQNIFHYWLMSKH